MSRVGKIARLPAPVREALNRRLHNGEQGPQILPWLNALPETQSLLTDFYQGKEINPQNLSDWRTGGYRDWEAKMDRTHRIKQLAEYAVKLTAADGGSIAEGASAIASGQLLELLEAATADDEHEKLPLEQTLQIVGALKDLRGAEAAKQRAESDREKLKQKYEEFKLAREKFQRDTAEEVLKSARDSVVQQIATAPMDHSAQLAAVGQHLFGDLWK